MFGSSSRACALPTSTLNGTSMFGDVGRFVCSGDDGESVFRGVGVVSVYRLHTDVLSESDVLDLENEVGESFVMRIRVVLMCSV